MNNSVKIGIGLIAIIGGIVAYRCLVPPSFVLESVDKIDKSGRFRFGTAENNFSLVGGKGIVSRCGWSLKQYSKNGKVYFDLYKKYKFIKTLAIV